LLIELATVELADNPSQYKWEEYLGYMGIILSSSLAIQRHWENEDIIWVYKDFCIDVGRWAMRQWPDFTEMEYREFLCDIIVLVANKRNDHYHDTKLIHGILLETCEEWTYTRTDLLSKMIVTRMKDRTFIGQTKNKLLYILGMKNNLNHISHSISYLWSPDEYFYNEKARLKHETEKNQEKV